VKTPPKVPSEPQAAFFGGPELQTGREKKQAMLFTIILYALFPIFFYFGWTAEGDPFDIDWALGDDAVYVLIGLLILCGSVIFFAFLTYITTESSDEKPPAIIKYEREMEQYQLKLEEYNEELKKESPFYVGDGSTGSEMKNTCKRCNKIWYLDAEELKDLENRLETSTKLMGQMGGLSMVTALFNPMLAAQSTTTMAANTGALKSLADELNEKSRCPECQSRSIERTLVGKGENTLHKKVIIKRKQSDSLSDQLKKLNELKKQGILDEKEFKSAKQKLIEKQ